MSPLTSLRKIRWHFQRLARTTIYLTASKVTLTVKNGADWIIDNIIRVESPVVREDFIPSALLLHLEGRAGLVAATVLVLRFIPEQCPGGNTVAWLAVAWTFFSFLYIFGLPFHRKKHRGVNIDVGSLLGIKYVRRFKKYPWWIFIPDVMILTFMVIHTGAAFSLFLPMFLVLGVLGDHTLILWVWRRLFLPLFIFLPYTLIIFLSTETGKSMLRDSRFRSLYHESFWAGDDHIRFWVAIFTWIIFVGATSLTSYVLRHLLLFAIQKETTIINKVGLSEPSNPVP